MWNILIVYLIPMALQSFFSTMFWRTLFCSSSNVYCLLWCLSLFSASLYWRRVHILIKMGNISIIIESSMTRWRWVWDDDRAVVPGPAPSQHDGDAVPRQTASQAGEIGVTVGRLVKHTLVHLPLKHTPTHAHRIRLACASNDNSYSSFSE